MHTYIKIFLMTMVFAVCTTYGESNDPNTKSVSLMKDRTRLFITEEDTSTFSNLIQATPLLKLKDLILSMSCVVDGLDQLRSPNLQNLTLYGLKLRSWSVLKVSAFHT